MFNNNFTKLDFSNGDEEFLTIEDAIKTQCPYCGTELEWKLTVVYNSNLEIPEIHGIAYSCGVDFLIVPDTEAKMYYIKEINRT